MPPERWPTALTAWTRAVSGSLSLPSPGCFSPFPHGTVRYRSRPVVSLGAWSPRLPTGFPVPGGTHPPHHRQPHRAAYGPLTRCGAPFQALPLRRTRRRPAARRPARRYNPPAAQGVRPLGRAGLGRSRFRSPLLPASRLLLPPRATEMFHFARLPPPGSRPG